MLFDQFAEITFQIKPGILPNVFTDDMDSVNALHDGVQMSLEGPPGLNFARTLSRLYGADRHSFKMPVELSFTAVALDGDPARIADEPIKIKLFHETGSTEEEEAPEYFEMFLNIDLPAGVMELNEKDTDFRTGVLKAFALEPN